jgi:hypothetical protein
MAAETIAAGRFTLLLEEKHSPITRGGLTYVTLVMPRWRTAPRSME